jgi:hypothetical protein
MLGDGVVSRSQRIDTCLYTGLGGPGEEGQHAGGVIIEDRHPIEPVRAHARAGCVRSDEEIAVADLPARRRHGSSPGLRRCGRAK